MLESDIEAPGTTLWESGTRTEASRPSRNGWGARNDTCRAGTRISPFLTLAPQHGGRGRRSARRLIPQCLGVGRCPFRGAEPMPSASTGRRVSPYRRRHQSRRQVLCSFRCYASGLLNGGGHGAQPHARGPAPRARIERRGVYNGPASTLSTYASDSRAQGRLGRAVRHASRSRTGTHRLCYRGKARQHSLVSWPLAPLLAPGRWRLHSRVCRVPALG